MITAVDTNVRRCLSEGSVIACDVVWTETATIFERDGQFLDAMSALDIGYSPLDRAAALLAAQAWRQYRFRGGTRQRVAADFLVGAHATGQSDRLLTRDRGFYRDYFEKLRIVDPTRS